MREVVVTRTELNEKLTIESGSYLENLNFYDILLVLYTMCQNICGLMLALLWLNSKSDQTQALVGISQNKISDRQTDHPFGPVLFVCQCCQKFYWVIKNKKIMAIPMSIHYCVNIKIHKYIGTRRHCAVGLRYFRFCCQQNRNNYVYYYYALT